MGEKLKPQQDGAAAGRGPIASLYLLATSPASALLYVLCCVPPESFKIQYLQFLAYTKTPQYKANLQQLLDQEKVCRLYLNVWAQLRAVWGAL